MNATKRKFNALLQGLGTSRPRTADDSRANSVSISQTTPSPRSIAKARSAEADILQKRRRLGLPEATAPTFESNVGQSPTGSPKLQRPISQPDGPVRRREEPVKYSPSDRAELLKRLSTFQEITDWTPKPNKVSEVEWAKRGWVCISKETVRCLLCHKELVVKLNRKLVDGKEIPVLIPSEIEEALVDKYADLIISSHREDCLWRRKGCDDSILRLSLTNPNSSLEGLRQRYDELCARKSFLPYEFNLRLPDEVDLDRIIGQLPPKFFHTLSSDGETTSTSVDRVALALALLGWQGLSNARIGAVPNSASCHTCLRRLGLWMFKSKEVSETGDVLVPAPMDFLDPAREHRFFCPWSNGAAQSRPRSQPGSDPQEPGWKLLVQTLTNDAHLRSIYEGRPQTKTSSESRNTNVPSTPRRTEAAASISGMSPQTEIMTETPRSDFNAAGNLNQSDEDEAERDARDKERWARLRRVKSLFDSKGSRRIRHSLSRPGTGYSAKSMGG